VESTHPGGNRSTGREVRAGRRRTGWQPEDEWSCAHAGQGSNATDATASHATSAGHPHPIHHGIIHRFSGGPHPRRKAHASASPLSVGAGHGPPRRRRRGALGTWARPHATPLVARGAAPPAPAARRSLAPPRRRDAARRCAHRAAAAEHTGAARCICTGIFRRGKERNGALHVMRVVLGRPRDTQSDRNGFRFTIFYQRRRRRPAALRDPAGERIPAASFRWPRRRWHGSRPHAPVHARDVLAEEFVNDAVQLTASRASCCCC